VLTGVLAFWDSRFGLFVIPSRASFAVWGMMSQPRDDCQDDLFRPPLSEIINLRHPLVRKRHSSPTSHHGR
jgi:hypothetical protein